MGAYENTHTTNKQAATMASLNISRKIISHNGLEK